MGKKVDLHEDVLYPFVEEIALGRRVAELTDEDMQEFDEKLNEMCAKAHDKFKDMGLIDITAYMVERMDEVFKAKEA